MFVEVDTRSFNTPALFSHLVKTCPQMFLSPKRNQRPPFTISTRNSRSVVKHYFDEIKDLLCKQTVDKSELRDLCIEQSDLHRIDGWFIVKPNDVLIGGAKGIRLSRERVETEDFFSQRIRVPSTLIEDRKWDCRFLAWIVRNDDGECLVNFCKKGIVRIASEKLDVVNPTLRQIVTNIGFHETETDFVAPRPCVMSERDVIAVTSILQKICLRIVRNTGAAFMLLGLDMVEGWCIEINHHPFFDGDVEGAEGDMCREAAKMIAENLGQLFL